MNPVAEGVTQRDHPHSSDPHSTDPMTTDVDDD